MGTFAPSSIQTPTPLPVSFVAVAANFGLGAVTLMRWREQAIPMGIFGVPTVAHHTVDR